MTIIEKDITTVTEGVIVHQVNCMGHIGGDGVSEAVIQKWPGVAESYYRRCRNRPREFRMRDFDEVVVENDLIVISLFSQYDDGNPAKTGEVYTDLSSLNQCLHTLCAKYAPKPVYIPYGIGCGYGGAHWETVSLCLGDIQNLIVCRLPNGSVAKSRMSEYPLLVINKDITAVTDGIVAHQVNCRDRIGGGVSGAIIKKWPKVAESYHAFCARNPYPVSRLGAIDLCAVDQSVSVVNVFTQLNYGNSAKTGVVYTDEPLLINCLHSIGEYATRNQKLVYIPYGIGCGLGGGNWERIVAGIKDIPYLVVCRV